VRSDTFLKLPLPLSQFSREHDSSLSMLRGTQLRLCVTIMADDRVVIAARSLIRVVRVPLHAAICGAEHTPRMTHPSSCPTTAQAIIDGNLSRAIYSIWWQRSIPHQNIRPPTRLSVSSLSKSAKDERCACRLSALRSQLPPHRLDFA